MPRFNKNNISILKKVINLCISYTLSPRLKKINTDFTLSNCLFRSVKLTKNADLDKYKYTGYSIRLNSRVEYSLPDGTVVRNVIIFGVDMSSSVLIDNKGKDILILGKGSTQGLDDTTFRAETLYPINFEQSGKRFLLSLYYNESNSFLFVNTTKVYQLQAKDSEIKDYPLCLGNVSKEFTINIMKKAGLKRVVTFLTADFNPIDNNDILDIHKYLMKRT